MEEMPDEGDYAWVLENPRLIEPFPVHASTSFFYVTDEIKAVQTNDEDTDRRLIYPIALHGDRNEEDECVDMIFQY